MIARAKRLLIVEDEPELRRAVRSALEQDGPREISLAGDGREALENLGLWRYASPRTQSRLPDVIFLDVNLPRVDGWAVLRAIRENPRTRHLPVVVVSGTNRPDVIRLAYELGSNSFLVKSASEAETARRIAEAAHYWLDLNWRPVRAPLPTTRN